MIIIQYYIIDVTVTAAPRPVVKYGFMVTGSTVSMYYILYYYYYMLC